MPSAFGRAVLGGSWFGWLVSIAIWILDGASGFIRKPVYWIYPRTDNQAPVDPRIVGMIEEGDRAVREGGESGNGSSFGGSTCRG